MDRQYINDFSDRKTLEKYSSAFTLSDMEIFIFPELYYPLILADIMSPELWKWREDPWFKDIEKKSFNNKANRIKQFIIQNYVFNLDLSTWGLTTKTAELERFKDFIDLDMLRQSNALFGYEGDKYYFDIDIRKHFGLDKFDSDIIPYWKTETIEAMSAFRHKDNFTTGAGECVSLSALYAAAMFVVGRVPLDKIFAIATPLHSQNFIMEKDGLITNNRRIVTKNMWYNGTSLSERARRAMENEKVTIVSHISGYIHTLYKKATIDKKSYDHFTIKLREFLATDLTNLIFINFLRFKSRYKTLFQYRYNCAGIQKYILLEKMFEYEHSSKFNVEAEARDMLLREIEGDDFHLSPIQGKIMLNDFETILDLNAGKSLKEIEIEFIVSAGIRYQDIIQEMFADLHDFIFTDPKLPDKNKEYIIPERLSISTDDTRDKIISLVTRHSEKSELALLTLYVYRQMDHISWHPFLKAAVERNPVCLTDLKGCDVEQVVHIISALPNESIYDGKRLALPDEVWNFRRGDGIEKALLLADIMLNNDSSSNISIEIENRKVLLSWKGKSFHFSSHKSFHKSVSLSAGNYIIKDTLTAVAG